MPLGSTYDPNQVLNGSIYDPNSLIRQSASMSDVNYQFSDFLNNLFQQTAQLDSDSGLQTDRTKSALQRRVQDLYRGYQRSIKTNADDFANRGMLYSGAYLQSQADNGQGYLSEVNNAELTTRQYLEDLQRNVISRKQQMEQDRKEAEMWKTQQEEAYKLQQAQMQAYINAQAQAQTQRDAQLQQQMAQQNAAQTALIQQLQQMSAQQQAPPTSYPAPTITMGGMGGGGNGAPTSPQPTGGPSPMPMPTGTNTFGATATIIPNPMGVSQSGASSTVPAPQSGGTTPQSGASTQTPQNQGSNPQFWNTLPTVYVPPPTGQAVNPYNTNSYAAPSMPPQQQPQPEQQYVNNDYNIEQALLNGWI